MTPEKARIEMVRQALRRWSIKPLEIKAHAYGENAVFKVRASEGKFIARISGVNLQTPVSVRGEVRFIEHCISQGVNAAKPIRTIEGDEIVLVPNLDSTVITNKERIITLFEKAKGRRISNREMTENFVFNWGAYVARMHEATKNFKQTKYAKRPLWHEVKFQGQPLIGELVHKAWFKKEWALCEEWLHNLPQEDFGLIHADPHESNFKVHKGEIYLFDFDDSCVCWRVYDLAVVFLRFDRYEDKTWTNARKSALLEGYRSVRPLPDIWEKRIGNFIRVRWLWTLAWFNMRQHVPRLRKMYDAIYSFVETRTRNGSEPLV